MIFTAESAESAENYSFNGLFTTESTENAENSSINFYLQGDSFAAKRKY